MRDRTRLNGIHDSPHVTSGAMITGAGCRTRYLVVTDQSASVEMLAAHVFGMVVHRICRTSPHCLDVGHVQYSCLQWPSIIPSSGASNSTIYHSAAACSTAGNRASTKAAASKGCRSSTVSPTPTNLMGIPNSSTTLRQHQGMCVSQGRAPRNIVVPSRDMRWQSTTLL